MFQIDLFATLKDGIMESMNSLVLKIIDSAHSESMRCFVEQQGKVAVLKAEKELSRIFRIANGKLMSKQKKVSRKLMPHIKQKLTEAYGHAKEIRGAKSLNKRKVRHGLYLYLSG